METHTIDKETMEKIREDHRIHAKNMAKVTRTWFNYQAKKEAQPFKQTNLLEDLKKSAVPKWLIITGMVISIFAGIISIWAFIRTF